MGHLVEAATKTYHNEPRSFADRATLKEVKDVLKNSRPVNTNTPSEPFREKE